jgi:hypothetical protein
MTEKKYHLALRVTNRDGDSHEFAKGLVRVLQHFDAGFETLSNRNISYKVDGTEVPEDAMIVATLTVPDASRVRRFNLGEDFTEDPDGFWVRWVDVKDLIDRGNK